MYPFSGRLHLDHFFTKFSPSSFDEYYEYRVSYTTWPFVTHFVGLPRYIFSIKYYRHNAFRTPHYTRNTSYRFLCSPFDEYYEHNAFRSRHARNTLTCDFIRSSYRQMPIHTMLFDIITCMFYFTCSFFNVCLPTKYHYCNRFLPCYISNTHHKNLHGHLSVNTSRIVLSTHHTCYTLPIKFSCLSLNKCHKCFAFDTLHSQHTS